MTVGTNVDVVPMRLRHLRGVLAIEEAVYPQPWSRQLFENEIGRPQDRRYVVAVGPRRRWWRRPVLGYAGVILQGDEAHISTVVVRPSMQRRKIGTRLLARVLDEAAALGATAVTLEVRAENLGAQRLYEGFGFAAEGVRRGYYGATGEDAVIMWLYDLQSGWDRAAQPPVTRGEG
jgi:[ribosomal protein S18]-alanine N-acetyltransferase